MSFRSSFFGIVSLLVGCSAPAAAPRDAPLPPSASSPAPTPAPSAKPTAASSASAASSAAAAPSAPTAPRKRHPRPTEEEWRSAPSIPAPGAADRGCRLLTLPDWFRVECSPKTPSGKEMLDVFGGDYCWIKDNRCSRLTDPAHTQKGTRTFDGMIFEGQRTAASFLWEDQRWTFEFRWPAGTPRPDPVGSFLPDPYEVSAAERRLYRKILACCQKELGEEACTGQVEDLDEPRCITLLGTCKKYLACARGEEPPPCPAGRVYYSGSCVRLCNPARPNCEGDERCTEMMGSNKHGCTSIH